MTFTGTDACGNSPKNVFVATFEENLFNGARDSLAEAVAEDCVLQIIHSDGVQTATGRDEVAGALVELSVHAPEVGHLEAAITHGKAAAAWGFLAGRRRQRWPSPFLARHVVHHEQGPGVRSDQGLPRLRRPEAQGLPEAVESQMEGAA